MPIFFIFFAGIALAAVKLDNINAGTSVFAAVPAPGTAEKTDTNTVLFNDVSLVAESIFSDFLRPDR